MEDDPLGEYLERLAESLAPHLQDDASGPLDEGSRAQLDEVFQKFHKQLKDLAEGFLAGQRKRNNGSVTPTLIVNDLYLRFRNRKRIVEQGKKFFFYVFYNEAQRVLIDRWRHRQRRSNLAGELADAGAVADFPSVDYGRIEAILQQLAEQEPRAAMLARAYFLTSEVLPDSEVQRTPLQQADLAELSGFSLRTVQSDLKYAKAFVRRALEQSD